MHLSDHVIHSAGGAIDLSEGQDFILEKVNAMTLAVAKSSKNQHWFRIGAEMR